MDALLMIADVGLPMVFVEFAEMVLAFLPVVLVEGVLIWWLLGQPFGKTVLNTALANLCSTLVGIPLAWVPMFVLELITNGGSANLNDHSTHTLWRSVFFQAAWLPPYGKPLAWMVPAASLVLLPLTFALSVLIEGRVLAGRWPTLPRSKIFRATLLANAASYLGLAAVEVFRVWSNLP